MLLWSAFAALLRGRPHQLDANEDRLPNSTGDRPGEKGKRKYQKNTEWQQVIGGIYSVPEFAAFPASHSPFETSEKLPFIVAAVGRPPHFSSKLKSAALCREAATPILQRSPFISQMKINWTSICIQHTVNL